MVDVMRSGDDGDLHVGERPGASDAIVGAGETDAAVAICTAGDGHPDGRLPCPRHRRCQPRFVVVGSLALHVGGDAHTGVEDVDQPAATDDLDGFTGERRADPIGEPGEADVAALIDPPCHPSRPRSRRPVPRTEARWSRRLEGVDIGDGGEAEPFHPAHTRGVADDDDLEGVPRETSRPGRASHLDLLGGGGRI